MILTSDAPERFGHTLANAGDVNGDGFDDLVVGTIVKYSGRAFIYLVHTEKLPLYDLHRFGRTNTHDLVFRFLFFFLNCSSEIHVRQTGQRTLPHFLRFQATETRHMLIISPSGPL
jgi:hypothetical protein